MQSVLNTVKGTALNVAEYLTPVLKVKKKVQQRRKKNYDYHLDQVFYTYTQQLKAYIYLKQWIVEGVCKCNPSSIKRAWVL